MSPESPGEASPKRTILARTKEWFIDSNGGMAILVGLAFLIAVLAQEKILVGGGFGHDGYRYGRWVQDFRKNVIEAGVSNHHIQRVLPSALLYLIGEALQIHRTPANVVRMFEALNIALIALSGLSWGRIARRLEISREGRWLGACLLFVSFGVMKWLSFNPVLVDGWAFASGFWLLDAYLARRQFLVGLVVVAGAFVWPTMLYMGLPLLLLPRMDRAEITPAPFKLHAVFAGLVAALWGAHVIVLRITRYYPGNSCDAMSLELFRLSAALVVGYLFLGLRRLLDARALFDIRGVLRQLWSWRTPVVIVVCVLIKVAQAKLATLPSGVSTWIGVQGIGYTSVAKPGISMLAHALFYGPLVLVIMLRWRDICERIQRIGVGLCLAVAMGVLLSVDSESRHLMAFVGLVGPFAIKTLDDLRLDRRTAATLCVLSLLFSKVWLTLDGAFVGKATEFPSQLTFMTIGPWMSMTTYLIQVAVVIPVALWVARISAPRTSSS